MSQTQLKKLLQRLFQNQVYLYLTNFLNTHILEKKPESAPPRQVVNEQQPSSLSSSANSTANENWKQPKPVHTNNMLNRSLPNRATVTRKTRTYVVDGVQVTSTSLHVGVA
jgi:hypothetical protein